ncbi:uncharacterized protein LOC122384303 [Amphibalanus amphitrite]|uniref:uncharacterized protein LOC122384303 n=1 Tax=Amphibalanus amphitrite TaxID=1232801 RepID=UPI001C8FB4CA|nr:uncharacterized protein LOC122384303 [Amphibalanus amphitrite]
MGSTHRPPLAVILPLAVAALSGGADSAVWYEDRISNGCRFEPTVGQAVTMACDYDGVSYSRTRFFAGELPLSIQDIRISNARGIIIKDDALTGLRNLRAFHLNNISNLRIGKTDWRSTTKTENMTITMNDINRLYLDRDVFSRLQSPGPEIVISGVTSCSIAESAFAADSVIKSVSFQNIQSLIIEDSAIQSQIDQVHINNTALPDGCGNNSFSGHVSNFILNRVTIVPTIRSGCLQADDGWGNLTVLSSQLGDIEPLGISGTFDHFQIRNSSVGRVGQSGLNLSATSFIIYSTEVKELSSHALDVRFNRSALLQMSSFMSVRANAFVSLAANPRRVATLSFQQVIAHEAEYGSLNLAEYGRVSQLDIALRMPCSCHPNRQALRLVAGDEMSNNDQGRGTRQVLAQVRCAAGALTPTLAEFVCSKCADRGEAASLCQAIEARSSGWKIWKLAFAIGPPLLVVAVAALVIGGKVRQRNTSPPSGISPSLELAQLPKPVAFERRYTAAPKPKSRQRQNAGGGVTPHQRDEVDSSGPGEQHHDLDSEAVYCELNDIRYVPKDLPLGIAGQPMYDDCGPAGQPVYDDCGPAGQPVYDDCGPAGQLVYDDCGPAGQPVYDDCGPAGQRRY